MKAPSFLRHHRLTAIWLLLVVATGFAWESVTQLTWLSSTSTATVLVVGIACLKARLVLHEFMEVRHGPLALRLFADAWVLGLFVAITQMARIG